MTKEEIINMIINSNSDIEVKYIIKMLKNKELINKDYFKDIINIINNTNYNSIKEYIYLSTINKNLIDKDYFIDYLKIISKTTESKIKLYNRLSLIDYINDNNILLDLVNIIEDNKFNDNINLKYLDKLIENLIIYNNKNKIPSNEFIELIKIFSKTENHIESFFYLNIITDKRVLDNDNRVLIASNSCIDTYVNIHNEYIDIIIDNAINKGIKETNNQLSSHKKLIKNIA